jgi:hypothetical protein
MQRERAQKKSFKKNEFLAGSHFGRKASKKQKEFFVPVFCSY